MQTNEQGKTTNTDTTPKKTAATVVTSENLAEFLSLGGKLEEKKPEQKPEEVKDAKPEETKAQDVKDPDEKAPEVKTEQAHGKKKNSAAERITSLVEERNAERAARLKLEQELEAIRAANGQAPAKADPDAEPLPEHFKDHIEYAKALSKYNVAKALRERDEQVARDTVVNAWHERQDAIRQEYDDYDETLTSSDLVVHKDIQQAVLESELGPWIVYHFAKNPEVLIRLNKLSTTAALREVGKLEAKLAKSGAQPDTKTATAASAEKPLTGTSTTPKRTAAPEPPTPIHDNNSSAVKDSARMSYEEWKEARKAGKIK